MLVREWMVTNVVSVTPNTSMLKASKLLKDNNIRRLPVIDENKKVIGILSDRDIKDASPSKATTLAIHELHYLLSEIKVKDIMISDPFVVLPTDTVESAALLMDQKGFGSLPVVDEDNVIQGIITDRDIFKIFAEVTGSHHNGIQIAMKFHDRPGELIPFLNLLHENGANLITLLSVEDKQSLGLRRVYVHLQPMEKDKENKLIKEIRKVFTPLYWVKEKVFEL